MPLILNGDGSVGPLSATEVGYLDGVTSPVQTQIGTKASVANQTFTGNIITPWDFSSGTTNVVYSQTFNDNISHQLTPNVQNYAGILFLASTSQTSAIPFYPNGGAGVEYRWTVLDPDTGWNVNWSGTLTFTQNGSGSHSFSVTFSGGNGAITVSKPSGAGNYTIRLVLLGGGGHPA